MTELYVTLTINLENKEPQMFAKVSQILLENLLIL